MKATNSSINELLTKLGYSPYDYDIEYKKKILSKKFECISENRKENTKRAKKLEKNKATQKIMSDADIMMKYAQLEIAEMIRDFKADDTEISDEVETARKMDKIRC